MQNDERAKPQPVIAKQVTYIMSKILQHLQLRFVDLKHVLLNLQSDETKPGDENSGKLFFYIYNFFSHVAYGVVRLQLFHEYRSETVRVYITPRFYVRHITDGVGRGSNYNKNAKLKIQKKYTTGPTDDLEN